MTRIIFILLLLFAAPAWAVNPNQIGTTVTGHATSNHCNTTYTIAGSYSPTANTDVIVIFIALEGAEDVTAIQYAGSENFVQAESTAFTSSNGDMRTEIWYLTSPGAGPGDIIITCLSTQAIGMYFITDWDDTDTTTPIGSKSKENEVTASTTCTMVSQGDSGSTLVAIGSWQRGDSDLFSQTPSGWTEDSDEAVGSDANGISSNLVHEPSPPNSLVITSPNSQENACISLELCPAGGCPATGRRRLLVVG